MNNKLKQTCEPSCMCGGIHIHKAYSVVPGPGCRSQIGLNSVNAILHSTHLLLYGARNVQNRRLKHDGDYNIGFWFFTSNWIKNPAILTWLDLYTNLGAEDNVGWLLRRFHPRVLHVVDCRYITTYLQACGSDGAFSVITLSRLCGPLLMLATPAMEKLNISRILIKFKLLNLKLSYDECNTKLTVQISYGWYDDINISTRLLCRDTGSDSFEICQLFLIKNLMVMDIVDGELWMPRASGVCSFLERGNRGMPDVYLATSLSKKLIFINNKYRPFKHSDQVKIKHGCNSQHRIVITIGLKRHSAYCRSFRHGSRVSYIRLKNKLCKMTGLDIHDTYLINSESNTVCLGFFSISCDLNLVLTTGNTFGGLDHLTSLPAISNTSRQKCGRFSDLLDDAEARVRNLNSFLTILVSNVRGGLGGTLNLSKKIAIKAASCGDTLLSLSECNCVESDARMLAATFGRDCRVSSLEDVVYKNGIRCRPAGARKKMAFGSCIVSKDAGLVEWVDFEKCSEWKFELVPVIITRGWIRGLKIGGYRSPSMTNKDEILAFYKQVSHIISMCKAKYELQFIIFAMDDNKTSSKYVQTSMEVELRKMGLSNLIGKQATRLGNARERASQPDTVWGWFDPFRCKISATVIPKLSVTMDHCAIRIRIDLFGVPPIEPVYREVIRKVRVAKDEDISAKLSEFLQPYTARYEAELGSQKLNDNIVDIATEELYNIIERVKEWGWKEKVVWLPDCIEDDADIWTVKIGIEHAKMQRIGTKLKKNMKDEEALREFKEAQEKCLRFAREKRDADCDRDLAFATGAHGPNLSNFYKWADQNISKTTFSSTCDITLTTAQKQAKLKIHDETFINRDSDFSCGMTEACDSIPDRRFSLADWDYRNDSCKLLEFIKSRKKIDSFYKVHASDFVQPISILLRMIERADYFPKKMRTSRATFIPGPRTIFSLEAISKIVEGVLTLEFDNATEEHYKINGDPGGFAYRKGRGVSSCLGTALTKVEQSPRDDGLSAVMVFCDLVKAFNSANRTTIVECAQKICGAGRIFRTRFENRTYTFEGEVRGIEYNRGVDAGTQISVRGFGWSMDTDCSTTTANTGLLCHPNYSDDRNITGSGSFVQSGKFQETISCSTAAQCSTSTCARETDCGTPCSYCWAKRERITYHETGSKSPEACVFTQVINGTETGIPDRAYDLKLGPVSIPVVDRQRVLGLHIATHPKVDGRDKKLSKIENLRAEFSSQNSQSMYERQAWDIIHKYGYFLEPDLNAFRSCAYRFQSLKDEQTPERLWLANMSYFVGKMRFCAAFYYLRSTQKQLETLRFYYGMSVSAILGLTAYETLGATCCKNMTVTSKNDSMKKLLAYLELPTLEQLAIKDSRVVVSQICSIHPEWFLPKNRRLAKKESERKEKCAENGIDYYPIFCNLKFKDTLVFDCWNLGKQGQSDIVLGKPENKSGPATSDRSKNSKQSEKCTRLRPYQRVWKLLIENTHEDQSQCARAVEIKEAFKVACLRDLGILEANDRQFLCRTPNKILAPDKRCPVYPPQWIDPELLRGAPVLNFSCLSPSPKLFFNKIYDKMKLLNEFPCLFCGDFVNKKSSKKCINCNSVDRVVHSWCLERSRVDISAFSCSKITEHYAPISLGASKLRPLQGLSAMVKPSRCRCLICGDPVASWEPGDVDISHSFYDSVVPCSFSRDIARPCRFGIHKICGEIHHSMFLGKPFDSSSFKCTEVKYAVFPETVSSLTQGGEGTESLISYVRSECPVKFSADRRKRRYENANNVCTFCNTEIPRAQSNHIYQHCPAVHATPPVIDPRSDLRAEALRCLAIARRRLYINSPRSKRKKRKRSNSPPLSHRKRTRTRILDTSPVTLRTRDESRSRLQHRLSTNSEPLSTVVDFRVRDALVRDNVTNLNSSQESKEPYHSEDNPGHF